MRKASPPNYDYTVRERSARRHARAAMTMPAVSLDAAHAAMLGGILADSGETPTAWVRRMIREQAVERPPRLD